LGPSGSGKSTLIRVVGGLQAATAGTVYVDDTLVTEPLDGVSLMFQDANLMPWRTVRDNIVLPLELRGVAKDERYQQVGNLLPLLGLQDFADAYPAELSGGMAQRVALGRVLIQQPQVVLLDEPFGALDAMTREKISFDLLRIWAREQQTIMMVTHDINEAVLLSDRILVLSQRPGRIIADITVPLDRPRTLDMIYTQPFIETARTVRATIDRA
jgi:NitT/TauT family transport system ATP-binding protein